MISDEALMVAYARGDEAAFEALFRRYAPLLQRVMRRRLPSESDTQDLIQQAFLQLHRARLDFRDGMRFRPWFFTIAFNLQREVYRRRRSRLAEAVHFDSLGDSVGAIGAPETCNVEDVHKALSRLPSETREVIALHWFEGLSFPEVAALVGASLSAVKVRAHRGYTLLRRHFDADS